MPADAANGLVQRCPVNPSNRGRIGHIASLHQRCAAPLHGRGEPCHEASDVGTQRYAVPVRIQRLARRQERCSGRFARCQRIKGKRPQLAGPPRRARGQRCRPVGHQQPGKGTERSPVWVEGMPASPEVQQKLLLQVCLVHAGDRASATQLSRSPPNVGQHRGADLAVPVCVVHGDLPSIKDGLEARSMATGEVSPTGPDTPGAAYRDAMRNPANQCIKAAK
jgi:hypothetical protein